MRKNKIDPWCVVGFFLPIILHIVMLYVVASHEASLSKDWLTITIMCAFYLTITIVAALIGALWLLPEIASGSLGALIALMACIAFDAVLVSNWILGIGFSGPGLWEIIKSSWFSWLSW